MKRMIPVLVIFVLLVGAGIAYAFWAKRIQVETIPAPETNSPVTQTGAVNNIAITPPPVASTKLPSNEGVNPTFTSFLSEESKSLDSTNVDVSQAEEKVKKQAAEMRDPEVKFARELVLTNGAPGNQRVMAMYLLSKANYANPLVAKTLADTILRPSNSDRAEPHTVDELANVQAKSFAIMAVDALAEQAAHDPKAKDELIRLGSQARDTTIQNYILEKIRSLPR